MVLNPSIIGEPGQATSVTFYTAPPPHMMVVQVTSGAGSRPRLLSSCSRTCSSQSSPPSRRTGSGARTRRAQSCTSAWRRHVQRARGTNFPPASLRPRSERESRLGRAERTGRTCGEAGRRSDGPPQSRSSGQSRQHRTTHHTTCRCTKP